MTKKEHTERNIGMTFDFIRYLIDHPEAIETIPNGAELDFIDKDMPFKVKKGDKGKKLQGIGLNTFLNPLKVERNAHPNCAP